MESGESRVSAEGFKGIKGIRGKVQEESRV